MATKSTSRFVCQSCGDDFLRWEGQCRSCGTWNSLVETVVRAPTGAARRRRGRRRRAGREPGRPGRHRRGRRPAPGDRHRRARPGPGRRARARARSCSSAASRGSASRPCSSRSRPVSRQPGPVRDRRGVGRPGPPARRPPRPARRATRAARPGPRRARHRLDRRGRPAGCARRSSSSTSIQTATVDELDGAAGSVGQVRESTVRLMDFAKGEGIAVVLVGHVTKDGSIAGPKTLEHLVDAVVAVEGERYAALRLVRARQEPLRLDRGGRRLRDGRRRPARGQRPGPGLPGRPSRAGPGQRRRADASRAAGRSSSRSRPWSRRPATGPPRARPAVSIRTGSGCSWPSSADGPGIGLGSHDVYANLAGGLSVAEPGLDLPLALALASSLRDRPIAAGHRRHRRGRAARGAARGQRPRAPPARSRSARASAPRSCPRPARRRRRRPSPACASREVATLREAVAGRPGGGPIGAWRRPCRRC